MSIVNRAKAFAKRAHRDQSYGELPFFIHCKQTALILAQVTYDEDLIAAGYLHDILENTKFTYDDLEKYFNEEIASLVREVTKSDYNRFPDLHSKRGIMLKFADRLSNLSHMESWSEVKQKEYMKKSQFWKI